MVARAFFYEEVTEVKVCFFPSLGFCFCCCFWLRRMLFSTGFLFALLVSLSEARCRLGFSRRIDAAIDWTALEGQNALAVIGTRGVVAIGKHDASSSSFLVKGDVGLLAVNHFSTPLGLVLKRPRSTTSPSSLSVQ